MIFSEYLYTVHLYLGTAGVVRNGFDTFQRPYTLESMVYAYCVHGWAWKQTLDR
jgi:hypothetical protein